MRIRDWSSDVCSSDLAYGEMVARVTRDWGVRLTFEPGRLIVGNAGVLVSRVIRVKQGETSSFIIVDAAMNDLIRPTLYEAWHDILDVEPREGRDRKSTRLDSSH